MQKLVKNALEIEKDVLQLDPYDYKLSPVQASDLNCAIKGFISNSLRDTSRSQGSAITLNFEKGDKVSITFTCQDNEVLIIARANRPGRTPITRISETNEKKLTSLMTKLKLIFE